MATTAKTINADIDIVNLALSKLGVRSISGFDDSTNIKAADVAKTSYDLYLKSVMEQYPWDFAMDYRELSPLATLPVNSYDYAAAFQVPTDCLRVVAVEGQSSADGDEWIVRGEHIFTNLSDNDGKIKVQITQYVTNVESYPPSFIDAVAERCAAEWASSILRVSSETAALRESADGKFRHAMSSDGGQGSPIRLDTNATSILVRRGQRADPSKF